MKKNLLILIVLTGLNMPGFTQSYNNLRLKIISESLIIFSPFGEIGQDPGDINHTWGSMGNKTYYSLHDPAGDYNNPDTAALWDWVSLPDAQEYTQEFIINGFVKNESFYNNLYFTKFEIELDSNYTLYYRKNLNDDWINCNEISDLLLDNPELLGVGFNYGDSLANLNGYCFSFQIKIEIAALDIVNEVSENEALKATIKDTFNELQFNISTPGNYELNIFDLSGRLIYSDKLNNGLLSVSKSILGKGILIYTIKGSKRLYSGKFYNNGRL